ncbi:conserved hypothetical protein [Paraburkholderia tropica]|uniref:helix-turn-helix domain-containing protein n=1 Tax=Paraburkholderia tropica TaxID=92647 RepID=UPI001CABFCFC|nr:helix-turn-helix domain-containing protein [Paraburkholderia tropica]CAG9189484.1 conserved hypothetical protein [Paraburkholderia tropica]
MGKRLSPNQWDEIRARYVGGCESAKVIAREFKISASAIYKRATRGNWPKLIDEPGGSPRVVDAALVARLECAVDRLMGLIGGQA